MEVDITGTGSDSGACQIITGQIPPVAVNATFAATYAVPNATLPDFRMFDLKGEIPREHISGDFATWAGFVSPGDSSQYERIDFMFGDGTNKRGAAHRQSLVQWFFGGAGIDMAGR